MKRVLSIRADAQPYKGAGYAYVVSFEKCVDSPDHAHGWLYLGYAHARPWLLIWNSSAAGNIIAIEQWARIEPFARREELVRAAGIQDRWLVKLDLASQKVVATADLTKVHPGAYGKAVWVDAEGSVWAPLTEPILAVYSADLELKTSYNLSAHGVVVLKGCGLTRR